jgi:hypothetical protein
MKLRLVRQSGIAAALLLMVGCNQAQTPAPSTPTIDAVGVATDVRIYAEHMRITLDDGSVHEISPSYRQLGECCGFWLTIIGSDGQGPFLASFPTQDGLPADCFRENAVGIERGRYIETQGVMWAKAPTFAAPDTPDAGSMYPAGTRFCFNAQGMVASTIGR